MRKKIIGLLFFSMVMMGALTYVNAYPCDTAALDRDRDRIADRDRDKIQDCTSEDCEDKLQLRDRYRDQTGSGTMFRNRTGLTLQIRNMVMNHIDDCDQSQERSMLQIRERIRILQCGDEVLA